MKKKIAPRKKPTNYWNTIEITVTQPGVDGFIEGELATGVSIGMKRIMLIKRIILSYGLDVVATRAPGVEVQAFVNLNTQQGETAVPALQENGTIYYHAYLNSTGGDGATAAEAPGGFTIENGFPTYVEFDDPLPVADDTLSLYFDTVGCTTAQVAVLKLYYAIAEVNLDEALTILESYR